MNLDGKINSENISYLYRELNKKDSQIKQLQKRISNLIDEKSELISEVNYLKNKNFDLSLLSEKSFIKNNNLHKQREIELLSTITNLENENNKLKSYISDIKNNENIIKNTTELKLSKANNEINNLLIMNVNKDNILSLIQNFLDKIKKALGDIKTPINFDIRIGDNKLFADNLKILETNIIKKISAKNNIFKMQKAKKYQNKYYNYFIKKKNEYNKTDNKPNFKKINIKKPKSVMNKKYINLNLNESFNFKSKINKRNINDNILRTPPKEINNISDYNDYDIISYLSTINNQTVLSRLNNTNFL